MGYLGCRNLGPVYREARTVKAFPFKARSRSDCKFAYFAVRVEFYLSSFCFPSSFSFIFSQFSSDISRRVSRTVIETFICGLMNCASSSLAVDWTLSIKRVANLRQGSACSLSQCPSGTSSRSAAISCYQKVIPPTSFSGTSSRSAATSRYQKVTPPRSFSWSSLRSAAISCYQKVTPPKVFLWDFIKSLRLPRSPQ